MQYHAWFEPLWRRLAAMAFCLAWLGLEAWHQPDSVWFWLALGMTGWGLWELFLSGQYGRKNGGS